MYGMCGSSMHAMGSKFDLDFMKSPSDPISNSWLVAGSVTDVSIDRF